MVFALITVWLSTAGVIESKLRSSNSAGLPSTLVEITRRGKRQILCDNIVGVGHYSDRGSETESDIVSDYDLRMKSFKTDIGPKLH